MTHSSDNIDRSEILIVGYGNLGREIGRKLVEHGFSVAGLRRSECTHDTGVALLTGDVTQPGTLAALRNLNPQILVYCVAADAQTDESYRAHYVDGLRHVLAALKGTKLRHAFFVSSTRVYGQATDAILSEADPALPSDFGGKRLLEGEQLLTALTCGHTALRLSGIYGPGRTRMLALASDPTRWPPNSWSNRIHRNDAAAFVVFLIQHAFANLPVAKIFIVTDNLPTPQHEVLRWLAERMGLKDGSICSPAPVGGKRLNNNGLRATGFQLAYPDFQTGYASLLHPYSAAGRNP